MAKIFLKGNPVNTVGELPAINSEAANFMLTHIDLSDAGLEKYPSQRKILNIFPSLDTAVCAASVRRFNAEASAMENTKVLCISKDLPFAHQRFCSTEGLDNVISLSQLRDDTFGKDYGVEIIDGPMAGLLARAVVVLDENNKVVYTELVNEITEEPDYEAALKALK